MAERPIADRFVAVIAEIRAVEPKDDDPMRYAIWHLQEQAEQAISNGIALAASLSSTARILARDHRKAIEKLRATEPKE